MIALAWAYTLAGAGMGMTAAEMTAMTPWPGQPSMPMPIPEWDFGYALLMLAMWWVMMVAMMLPSAAPMILLYDRVQLHRQQQSASAMPAAADLPSRFRNVPAPAVHDGQPAIDAGTGGQRTNNRFLPCAGRELPDATTVFTLGYLVAWLGFSVLAVFLQWWLTEIGFLSPMLTAQPPLFASAVLIAAGLYQLSPLKYRCLEQCQAPAAFVATHWQPGKVGAWRMGLEHGAVCLGCCWGLMVLLFVGGIMNLYWIAGLALLVLAEKAIPAGRWVGYASGVVLIGWGAFLLTRAS